MQLGEYLDSELLVYELAASTKNGVLAELVEPLTCKYPHLDATEIVRILQDREMLGTTGIGDGIAIPHGKVPDLERIVVVVGRSSAGIDFEALDYKLCSVFFLVLAPEQAAGTHLRILAQISRLLKDKAFREAFSGVTSKDALWALLQHA